MKLTAIERRIYAIADSERFRAANCLKFSIERLRAERNAFRRAARKYEATGSKCRSMWAHPVTGLIDTSDEPRIAKLDADAKAHAFRAAMLHVDVVMLEEQLRDLLR